MGVFIQTAIEVLHSAVVVLCSRGAAKLNFKALDGDAGCVQLLLRKPAGLGIIPCQGAVQAAQVCLAGFQLRAGLLKRCVQVGTVLGQQGVILGAPFMGKRLGFCLSSTLQAGGIFGGGLAGSV